MSTIADELALLRRVVARHIADGVSSGVPSAEVLARSLLTELDMAGLRVDVPEGVASRRCDTPGCERETPPHLSPTPPEEAPCPTTRCPTTSLTPRR